MLNEGAREEGSLNATFWKQDKNFFWGRKKKQRFFKKHACLTCSFNICLLN